MSIKKEKTNNKNEIKITFTVEPERFDEAIEHVFKENAKYFTVPGFRKGKAPFNIVAKQYGVEMFYEDAFNHLLPEVYDEEIEKNKLEVVSKPEIKVLQMEKGKELIFEAVVATRPEVELGQYKGIELKKVEYKVKAEDVKYELEHMAEHNSRMVSVEDRAVKKDDIANIDYLGTVNGVEFAGGKAEKYDLTIGSNTFIPGFEDQLVGHKAGETVDVVVTFPEDYQAADLAGKEAKFVTTIHEVKEKEVPALDDELAKDIDEEVETLDELKEKYRKELAEGKEAAYKDAVESAAIDLAVENAEIVDLPEEMVHEEVHRSVNEFLGNMQRQGISPDMYFQITGTTQEDLHKQHEADAEARTKTNLVIEAIAKAEGFEASAEEIETEISSLANDYNMEADRVRQLLSEDMLKHDITIKKAVEVITSTAKVK